MERGRPCNGVYERLEYSAVASLAVRSCMPIHGEALV